MSEQLTIVCNCARCQRFRTPEPEDHKFMSYEEMFDQLAEKENL